MSQNKSKYGLRVGIYENDECEKWKLPYLMEDKGNIISSLENYIGMICRKYGLYFRHGELVFNPSEKRLQVVNDYDYYEKERKLHEEK